MEFLRPRHPLAIAFLLFAFALPAHAATPFTTNLQLWDTGPDVQSLQQFLNVQGFVVAQSGAGSPGHETTTFANHTYQALLRFQAAHDLPATGFFGPLTRATVNSLASSGTNSSGTGSGISSAIQSTATGTSTTPPSATSTQATATAASSTPSSSSQATATTSPSYLPYIPGKTPLPGYAPGQIIFIGGGSSNNTPQVTTPPSAPTNLTAVASSSSEIDLSWTASTNNVGVTGYQVFRNSVQIATSTLTTYADTGLTASTTYTYTVEAFDAAGNVSATSNSAIATTDQAPYIAQAVHFDGASYLEQIHPTDIPNSPVGAFSVWLLIPSSSDGQADGNTFLGTYGGDDPINDTQSQFGIFDGEVSINLELDDTTPDAGYFSNDSGTSTRAYSSDTWFHLFASWNTDFAAPDKILNILVNGTNVVDASDYFDLNGLAAAVQWSTFHGSPGGNGIQIPSVTLSGFPSYAMDMADFQIWDGTYIAPTPENLAKFISNGQPVDPAVAAAAFGQQTILFSGDTTTFGTNQGTGGAFTLTGTLTNASTSPSN